MTRQLSQALLLAAAGGYLLGSVPFGLILTRAAGLGDLRRIGSGNIGATNVLRTGNRWLAAATLLLDGGKALAAVLLSRVLLEHQAALVAALAVILGHMFPVWLGFRGGKGVASGFGVLFGLVWPAALVAASLWLLMALVFRISSLGAVVAFAAAPVVAWATGGAWVGGTVTVMSGLILWRHEANIRRLLAGTEPRLGQKA